MEVVPVEVKRVADPSDIDDQRGILIFSRIFFCLKLIRDAYEILHFANDFLFRQILEDFYLVEFESIFKELLSNLSSFFRIDPWTEKFFINEYIRNLLAHDVMLVNHFQMLNRVTCDHLK